MLIGSSRARSRGRRLTAIEVALGFALVGGTLAVALPVFARDFRSSRFVEPVAGLERIGAGAMAYAASRAVGEAFPAAQGLTPAAVPRGQCVVDPPGTWDRPTWQALQFSPAPADQAHCYAFEFDSALGPGRSTFRATAHGDLDGDGITSTFEITGHAIDGDARGPAVDPGMFVDAEVE